MDVKQLRTFAACCRTLNFTLAADELGCSQANVSQQIQQLEKELNTRLFERLGKKTSLTGAGEVLLRHAALVIRDMDEAREAVRNSSETVVIGAAESVCTYRLPGLLKTYRTRYPDIHIVIKLLDCAEYVTSLENNEVDILFSLGPKLKAPNCRVVRARSEGVSVCAHPGHPLTRKKRLTRDDFAAWPVLLTGDGCWYRTAFLRYLEAGYVYPKIAMETNSLQAIKQAAVNGVGLCVLPDMAVADEVRRRVLLPLPVKGIAWGVVSQIVHHKDKWLSPALRGLLELIAE